MYSILYCLCVLFLLALILFWNCKKHPHTNLSREFYLQSLNDLRGLFALEIVIGHVIRYEQTILYPIGKFMICSVAFFFFMSAFGMAVSCEKKENYVGFRFLLSKPGYLLAFSFIVFLLYRGIDALCPQDLRYYTSSLLYTYRVKTNWYIWMLIIFYLLFFFTYKFLYRIRLPFMCVATVFLAVAMHLNGFSKAWVASTFAFPCGLIMGEQFSKCRAFLFSRKGVLTLVLLSVFGLTSLFVAEDMLSIIFMRNAMCLAAIFLLIYICSYVKVGNNAVARYLNKYASEIYLMQFIWLDMAEAYGLNYMVRLPLVLAATFISAMLLHPVIVWLKKIL